MIRSLAPVFGKALLGCLAAVALVLAVRAWFDGRLAAEARRQAALGEAETVAQVASNWPESLVEVALVDRGEAGRRAQQEVFRRLDAERAANEARYAGAAIRVAEAVAAGADNASEFGTRWSEVLLRRLSRDEPVGDWRQRLALQAAIDDARGSVPTVPLPATPVRPSSAAMPAPVARMPSGGSAPAPSVSEPAVAAMDESPDPPRMIAESLPAPADESPSLEANAGDEEAPLAWQRANTPATSMTEAPSPLEIESPGGDVPLRDRTDRDLLAAFVDDAAPPSDRPAARGPVAAGDASAAPASDALRRVAIREELARRGYSGVTREQVAQLLSPDEWVRAELARRLPGARWGDPTRLLVLLTTDESGRVREAAVSALASSPQRALVEHALSVAIADEDPRVGRLVPTLRERLR